MHLRCDGRLALEADVPSGRQPDVFGRTPLPIYSSRVTIASRASSPPRVLVSCGEPSGDLYAGDLVRHLRDQAGPLEAFGLGGDRVQAEGGRLLAHVKDLAVVGLLEVLRHLRHLRAVFRAVLEEVDRDRPAVAVLVDYADFNLRLARELKRRGVPVVYYVSPQVWAWRRGRVRAIRESVAQMIVIFPFEEPLYREAGIPVTFVGHPLVDLARPAVDPAAFLTAHGLDATRPVVAVLPGSRRQEVAHNLPPIAGALRLLRARCPDLQLALAVAPSLDPRLFDRELAGLGVTRITGHTHALLGVASGGIIASGTATIEAALMDLPMVVVYRLSRLTYTLGRPLVQVPHFAMANLIAGREVVKELIQGDFRPAAVSAELLALLENPSRREAVRQGLADIRARLGPPGASARAAAVVARILSR
jgi:lipid-A-disaccharide synthase